AETGEGEVVRQLVELEKRRLAGLDGAGLFSAEQNARLVRNAELYYRAMFASRDESWNLRDGHMAETLDALLARPGDGRLIVWAHNSHLGDARATEMGERGELNLGQLARQRYGDQVFALGFSTWAGTVTAAHQWGGPAERMRVRKGLAGSYEDLFHQ